MDRRSFNKLVAGTVAGASLLGAKAAQDQPALQKREISVCDAGPSGGSDSWELVILDSMPPHSTETGGTATADLDGDGKTEVVIATNGALLWYRPSTAEKGVIVQGRFGVGVAIEDIDGDGRKEVVAGKSVAASPQDPEKWGIFWYKSGADLSDPWTEHVLDPLMTGLPHDILFGDVDGDGRRELVANAMYSDRPGLNVYKVPADPTIPWKKQVVQEGLSAEGTAAGDLDGDGKDEIVSGPYWYSAPAAGAFSGQPWKTHSLAPGFREFCRAVIIDVNGDGRMDVVLFAPEQHGKPAAHGQNDGVRNQIRGQHPGGFVDARRKIAGDIGQGHVDDRGIEHLHEGRQHDGHGDDPGVDW